MGGLFIAVGVALHFGLGWPFFWVLGALLVLWVPVEWIGSRFILRDGTVVAQETRAGPDSADHPR